MSVNFAGGSAGRRELKSLLEAYERDIILVALAAAGGSQRRAAEALGLLPTTLCEKLKRLGIEMERTITVHPVGEAPQALKPAAVQALPRRPSRPRPWGRQRA